MYDNESFRILYCQMRIRDIYKGVHGDQLYFFGGYSTSFYEMCTSNCFSFAKQLLNFIA